MTKKPTHLHHAEEAEEPKELGPEPVDIIGKEPVHVRDWDEKSLVYAIRNGQRDIMEAELAYLLRSEYWQQPRSEPFEHTFKVPADIVEDTLALCRLDAIPVFFTQLVEWPLLESATETRVR